MVQRWIYVSIMRCNDTNKIFFKIIVGKNMSEYDNLIKVQDMFYCKSDLKRGCDHKSKECVCKPINVTDMNGKINKVRLWKIDLYDKNGKPVRIQCKFGNTTGKAKASGARARLEVYTEL